MQNFLFLDQKTGDYPTFNELISSLTAYDYERVHMVLGPGEFAVRGDIIDVFAVHQQHPVRIEYFDQTIERMARFLVQTQRSLDAVEKFTIYPNTAALNDVAVPLLPETGHSEVLSELNPGDYVIHEDYGIGIFSGLLKMVLGGREGEYVLVQYKGNDKLYVPLDKLTLLHRYSGADAKPRINGLSDGVWTKVKARVKKAAVELAEDIYLTQKARNKQDGFSFSEDSVWQIDMEEAFEFCETPDQKKAIRDIKADMESEKPMDRLLCGDVGFGKTEVILRAAFKAVENNKQVAILVPTTILAEQHFRTFSSRFSSFPHRVEVLSRFRTKEDEKRVLAGIKRQTIDVVIGTHRLLQKDVIFADLGLVIIDEEQRFGVTHKERLKKLKTHVDIITMTATPIPRTLYMALSGAKDLSIIETPPVLKKPVMTTVLEYNDAVVIDAVKKEVEGGGQVFYVFNQVEKMASRLSYLQALMPDVSFGMAHGQMKPTELEKVMIDFYHNRFSVLLCSTIIETGLDIPNVNTIIIEAAENFGISQIHQLRGRVGRAEKQGNAFLLYSQYKELSSKSKKRLQAVKEYAALGSGYKLALKDLEIRGAGTLLGERQHGHMTAVGFELYCKLLEDAVHTVRKDPLKRRSVIAIRPEIKAYIPDTYIEDPRERLAIYQRMVGFSKKQQLDDLIEELEDRYGELPKIVSLLLAAIYQQLG